MIIATCHVHVVPGLAELGLIEFVLIEFELVELGLADQVFLQYDDHLSQWTNKVDPRVGSGWRL